MDTPDRSGGDTHREEVLPGVYRHFKGGLYTVTGMARHSETLEHMVVYHDAHGNQWVRPLAMFNGTTDTPSGPKPRFERLGD